MNENSDNMKRTYCHQVDPKGYELEFDNNCPDDFIKSNSKNSLDICDLQLEIDKVKIPERNVWIITLRSLVETFYQSFVLEDKRNHSDLLAAMFIYLEVPIKNIKIYQDPNKEKSIRFDDEYLPLFNDKNEVTMFFEVTPDFGCFIKQDKLSDGSFASVYRCTEYGTKEVWCVKKFKLDRQRVEDVLPINREMEIFSKLESHPRIVRLERNFQTEKASFIVMEYMKQGSLRTYLNKNGPLSESELIRFAKQILEAIDYLHEKNIIHRDLKGPKLLLDDNFNLKLCGFVSGKILKGVMSVEDFRNGAAESVVGTANWMAPEVINGEKYGSSADIWSFGAIMVEMMTGKPPYSYFASFQVIFKVGTSKKLEFAYPAYSSDKLRSFVEPCLNIDPMKRPTVKELMEHEFLK